MVERQDIPYSWRGIYTDQGITIGLKDNQESFKNFTVTAPEEEYYNGQKMVKERKHCAYFQQNGCLYFIDKMSNVQLYSQKVKDEENRIWQSKLAK